MPASALNHYLDRVRASARRLSPLEEKRLAQRVQRTGDLAAARALVNAHLPLVVKIARDFRHLHGNLLELIQEGNLALMRAVHRYDPERCGTISAYVASWVRTYLERFVVANLGRNEDIDVVDVTDDETATPADLLFEEQQDRARLAAVLPAFEQRLTPREREIFRARLVSDEPSTLSRTGLELGLSAERIRQIERDLTDRLRAQIADDASRARA
jgi:RNA polymerase sigma factor (sigma-70 family)